MPEDNPQDGGDEGGQADYSNTDENPTGTEETATNASHGAEDTANATSGSTDEEERGSDNGGTNAAGKKASAPAGTGPASADTVPVTAETIEKPRRGRPRKNPEPEASGNADSGELIIERPGGDEESDTKQMELF